MYYNYVYHTTNLSRVGGSMPELPVYIENPVPSSFRGSGPDRTVTRHASQVNGSLVYSGLQFDRPFGNTMYLCPGHMAVISGPSAWKLVPELMIY